MKCDENGGCPLKVSGYLCGLAYTISRMNDGGFSEGFKSCSMVHKDCHFTPDLFPIIRAMIAGKVQVNHQVFEDEHGDVYDRFLTWKPREDKPCPVCGGHKVVLESSKWNGVKVCPTCGTGRKGE